MRTRTRWRLGIAATLAALASCRVGEDRTYTPYRKSAAPSPKRIHVAPFDADESEEFNRGNCEKTRELFQAQPGMRLLVREGALP